MYFPTQNIDDPHHPPSTLDQITWEKLVFDTSLGQPH
jgi:hypothetical protein